MQISGGEVRLASLCDDFGRIAGMRAEGCVIRGPAVIYPDGSTFQGCSFDAAGGGPDAVLWEVDPVREVIVGAVHVKDCTFVGCTFVNIGVAGHPDFIAQLARDFFGVAEPLD